MKLYILLVGGLVGCSLFGMQGKTGQGLQGKAHEKIAALGGGKSAGSWRQILERRGSTTECPTGMIDGRPIESPRKKKPSPRDGLGALKSPRGGKKDK